MGKQEENVGKRKHRVYQIAAKGQASSPSPSLRPRILGAAVFFQEVDGVIAVDASAREAVSVP